MELDSSSIAIFQSLPLKHWWSVQESEVEAEGQERLAPLGVSLQSFAAALSFWVPKLAKEVFQRFSLVLLEEQEAQVDPVKPVVVVVVELPRSEQVV